LALCLHSTIEVTGVEIKTTFQRDDRAIVCVQCRNGCLRLGNLQQPPGT